MSVTYKPSSPVGFTTEQSRWIRDEFQRLKNALEASKTHDVYDVLHAAPTRIYSGMIVYADGTDWNPGSGAGVYRRSEDNTTWVHLG